MRRPAVRTLDEHPNVDEILGVLAQIPHIRDRDLPALAAGWVNTATVAAARSAALQPDNPLVIDALAAFDAVQSLFADEADGARVPEPVSAAVAQTALKAIRDAVAAAFARPVLPVRAYAALMAPWRAVYPHHLHPEPDLGPEAERVKAVLEFLPTLAERCHSPHAAGVFASLARIAAELDADLHAQARNEAWRAAVLTSRRRVWGLVRRDGSAGLRRYCTRCRRPAGGAEEGRVLELCLDAACALLVADTVDELLVEILTLPLGSLIPAPRAERP